LTNLLPAGLQDFFQVLNVSNATTTLECPVDQNSQFKSGLFGGQFSGSILAHENAKTQEFVVNDELLKSGVITRQLLNVW